MFKLTWKSWLAVWLGLAVLFTGLFFLLLAQGAGTAAYWVSLFGGVLGNAWTVVALVRWREVTWVKRLNTFVLTSLGFGLALQFFLAIQWQTGLTTTLYLYLAVIGFLVGINVLRLILRPGHPIFGVARTMLEEALRMGIALIFIIALLVLLVFLPLILGSEDRVTYMVQRFLMYSTGTVSLLLGLMTVLLGARSVSLELSSRQAHMTLTKPLSRWQYLLGKWLGIVLLNAVLVGVAGVAIYGFTMGIARNPSLNDLDRNAVDREVLTARVARVPGPMNGSWDQMYINVLEEKQRRDPSKFGQQGTAFGSLSDPLKQEVVAETIGQFYTVDGGTSKEYRFTGLENALTASERSIARGEAILREQSGLGGEAAKAYVQYVLGRAELIEEDIARKVSIEVYEALVRELEREKIQLVLTPDTSPEPDDQFVEFYLKLNNQPYPRLARPGAPPEPINRGEVAVESPYEVNIPASMIASDGTLVVTIIAPKQRRDGVQQPFVEFNYKDAQIELFYRVGSFESNLFKSMLIIWLKLCFLAMLGLAVGSLLSFPVAATAGLVVFAAATFSGVINESLDSYASAPTEAGVWAAITGTVSTFFTHLGQGNIYDAFKLLLRVLGESFMLLIPSFGEFGTGDPLSSGRVIGNGLVIKAILKIGLLWTGVVGLIGLYMFSRKEIARVTV